MSLKENHKELYNDVNLYFQDAIKNDFKDISKSYAETIDGVHGRVEIRRYPVVSDIDWLEDKSLWKGLKSIGMVERERHIGNKNSCETSYYLLSHGTQHRFKSPETEKQFEKEHKYKTP